MHVNGSHSATWVHPVITIIVLFIPGVRESQWYQWACEVLSTTELFFCNCLITVYCTGFWLMKSIHIEVSHFCLSFIFSFPSSPLSSCRNSCLAFNMLLGDLCQQVYENNNVLIVWIGHRSRRSESWLVDVLKFTMILILSPKVTQ